MISPLLAVALVASTFNPDTAWMAGKLGVFQHRLYGKCPESIEAMKALDPKAMAAQLADIGADYFCITLNQCVPSFLVPNDVYEDFRGSPHGTVCNPRDIAMELADALAERGIRLMLYSTGTPPRGDCAGVKGIGYDYHGEKADPTYTKEGVKRWAQVLAFWSRRYGSKVSGWWLDGCYKWGGFDTGNDASNLFADALKSGNPHAVITFNPGFGLKPHSPREDYLAGEINEPFCEACGGRWLDGRQWHLLTYTYSPLGFPQDVRYLDGEWIDWLRSVLANGGAVTIDAHATANGTLKPLPAAQLKRVFAAVRGRLDPNGPDARKIAAENELRRRTDAIEAAVINIQSGEHKFFNRGYALEASVPDRALVRKAVDGTEIWSDAIQAALDAKGGVRLPPRPVPYVIDRPIVLKSGQSIWAGVDVFPLTSSHRGLVRGVKGLKGPLLRNAARGDRDIFVKGILFETAENPAQFEGVDGLVVRDLAFVGCKGTGLSLKDVASFRADAIVAVSGTNRLTTVVTTDAECRNGFVRNVSGAEACAQLTALAGTNVRTE